MQTPHEAYAATARAVMQEFIPASRAALEPLPSGLINTTWKVSLAEEAPGAWVLQRLHPGIPAEVNLNIEVVTAHLAARGCLTPQLRRTHAGALWVEREGAAWRLMSFIDGVTHDVLPDLGHARTAGAMLGAFHTALADFDPPLPCPRPPVHEPARHQAFLQETLARHPGHPLAKEVGMLAAEIEARAAELRPVPVTPIRLLHGDPKLSNLRFTPQGGPRCLVDLDTLTRAVLPFELGDALRSWCNPHAEDAAEASFDLAICEAALAGYAAQTRDFLAPDERTSFIDATLAIQLELAMRFAADALNETYFGWNPAHYARRGDHNLHRARNQLASADALRAQLPAARQLLAALFPAGA